ncbi:unnamed protein product [Vitrella brassicaformis CCMP3155]|uniref:Uncharacterized protein n=1 Tax=Vitrella brassicaformis (strain CCMP3155) TaxID=1169540 RepID=A0A0G4H417_VITBC|nr:unnamed protein product [Vitrella brassicaformis CCMP3155]|eukprot:CEM38467.1 unnamed protein product [Vitrella brassicaformis CCMP3155]
MLSLGPSNEAAAIDTDAGSDQAVIGEQSIELRTKMDLWRVMDCFVEGEHRTGRFSAALWIHPGDGNKRLIPPPPGTFPPTRGPQNRCAKRPRVDRSAAARDDGRRYGGWRCVRWLPIVEISVKAHFDDPTDPFREAAEPLSSRLAIRLSPSMEYFGITVQEDDHEGLLGEDADGEGDGGGGSDIEIDSDVLLLTDAALEIESPPDVPAEREQSVADGRGEPVADGQQQQGQERAMVIGASDVDPPDRLASPYDAPPPTADDNAEVIGEEGEGEEDDSSDLTMWSLRLHLDSSVRHGGMMRRFALSLNESHVRMMAANCGVQIGE